MKKIISLFQRNYEGDRLVRDEIVPGAEWVVAGEGVATRKWDGTACMVKDGELWVRYDAKQGKTPPPTFVPAMDPDPITGHWAGWVRPEGPQYAWHREAFAWAIASVTYRTALWVAPAEESLRRPMALVDGTYELCGPHFNGNPEGFRYEVFIPHGKDIFGQGFPDPPSRRTFEKIKEWFGAMYVEGIVWHHPDGRMVKIKRRDFGLPWPVKG